MCSTLLLFHPYTHALYIHGCTRFYIHTMHGIISVNVTKFIVAAFLVIFNCPLELA